MLRCLLYAQLQIYTECSLKAKSVFLNRPTHLRSSSLFAPVAILACAVCALAQSGSTAAQAGMSSHPIHVRSLQQTKLRMRAGEVVPVAVSRETLDFVRNARNRVARTSGVSETGFILGPSVKGDQVVLAASLMMKPGEYTVSLSAVSETGEERVMTLNVTLDPMQTVPLSDNAASGVLNGWQAQILSTQALIAQGWVVQGAFEQITPELHGDIQSQLVLGDKYDSLDTAISDQQPRAR
jgi:hypothetical protein